MKINNISFLNYLPAKNIKTYSNNHSVAFCSDLPKEIIKSRPDGTKIVLKKFYQSTCDDEYDYIGFLDKNNKLIKDIRFDRRYNEIRAIDYQKPSGVFYFIQNGLTVTFDKDKNITNVYLISKDGENSTHSVLNDKHGLSINTYDKDNNVVHLDSDELNKKFLYFIDYTKAFLKEAQDNNLFNSKNALNKFLRLYTKSMI